MNESNPNDVYELKFKVSETILATLNGKCSPYYRLYNAIGESDDFDDQHLGREGYIDLLDAVVSGKRVVNPKTDRERIAEIIAKHRLQTADGKTFLIDSDDYVFLMMHANSEINGGDSE